MLGKLGILNHKDIVTSTSVSALAKTPPVEVPSKFAIIYSSTPSKDNDFVEKSPAGPEGNTMLVPFMKPSFLLKFILVGIRMFYKELIVELQWNH